MKMLQQVDFRGLRQTNYPDAATPTNSYLTKGLLV
jgi:hypothetical protein